MKTIKLMNKKMLCNVINQGKQTNQGNQAVKICRCKNDEFPEISFVGIYGYDKKKVTKQYHKLGNFVDMIRILQRVYGFFDLLWN